MPVPQNLLQRIYRTSPEHIGALRDTVNFVIQLVTLVLAATDGMVTYVKDDSNVGGLIIISEPFLLYHNKAPKRGLSRYGHLVRNGSKARKPVFL